MLAAIGIDAARAVRRGVEDRIFHLHPIPLIVLSPARSCSKQCPSLRFHRWTYPIAAVLFGLHIAIGQAEADQIRSPSASGPESICAWNPYYIAR